MPSLKKLALAIAGLSCFPLAHAQTYSPKQVGLAAMQLNAQPLDVKEKSFSLGGSVWNKLRNNFRMGEVNSELVRRHESKFMTNSAYFTRTMERSRPYMYHISNEVAKRGMPAEIALLPFIESAFVTKAKSHVGASGLWQFMPATGRHYGLEQTPLYDGRHDIYAATNAALNYLQYLHSLFGDWSLALAAYNWGEGNVGRAIKRAQAQGLAPTYENLKMPSETRNYVPKLLAVRNIVNNPNAYGIRFSDLENKPYFQTVSLNQPADISAITRLAQISESEFLQLNPAFKTPVYIPKSGRKLLLPAANAATFEKNFQKADKNSLLSWHVYTPYSRTNVDAVAAEAGMSASELKRLNGLRTNNISAGHSILVSKNFVSGNRDFVGLDTDRNASDNRLQTVPDFQRPTTHQVQTAANQAAGNVDFVAASRPQTVARHNGGADSAASPGFQTASAATAPQPQRNFVQSTAVREQQAQAAARAAAQNSVNGNTANAPRPVQIQPAQTATPPVQRIVVQRSAAVQAAEQAQAQTQTAPRTIVPPTVQPRPAAPQAVEEQDALLDLVQKRTAAQAAPVQMPVQTAPDTAMPTSHRVETGDTLYNIAKRYQMSVQELAAANHIYDNTIKIGQVLKVGAAAKAALGR
ncbi:MAG: transglycosylase SLT domain-containing protein [Neisseria sp.]|nr:transglycosylase SLT domain-containing protein [Neisseria sp.]